MKTTEKLLTEIAKEYGYASFPCLVEHLTSLDIYEIVIKVMEQNKEALKFATKLAKTMKELGSSHIYFLMQQAYQNEFGENGWEMTYEDCEKIWDKILQNETNQ